VGNGEHQLYQLTGVVCHIGLSIAHGHYISYVLAEEKWLKADDTTIREVRYETVKQQAYLLFYVRI
jgi:ubiquitin C-terminal hydrolase